MKTQHIIYLIVGMLFISTLPMQAETQLSKDTPALEMNDGRSDKILFRDINQPHRIGVFATPSLAQALYMGTQATQTGPRFELGFGLDWEYRFAERWSFGIAISYMRYRSELAFDRVYRERAMKTPELYGFFLCQTSNQTEAFTSSVFELPLLFRYQFYESQSLSAFVGFGPMVGIKYKEQSEFLGGYYNRTAEFRDRDVIIDDFVELGFGRFDNYLNPEDKSSFKVTLGAAVELGIQVPISERWMFSAAVQGNSYAVFFGQEKHANLENLRFSSTFTSDQVEKKLIWGAGLRIGFSFLF